MKRVYKVAFAGFRHGHINSLLQLMEAADDFEVVAACEEDSATRRALQLGGSVTISHDNFDTMLQEVECDIVAIGDYYAKRGSLAIRALKAGRHVIADKPLCTSLDELAEIECLAQAGGLKVGCMLELRANPVIATVRELILAGRLGKITQVMFTGQHPLNRDTRPEWYFEPGKHGGTANDIASHALDIIPWLTGLPFAGVTAAREWQAFDVRSESFRDASQMMFELEGGCGVMGDVSYSAPNNFGYSHPLYWRFTIWGSNGLVEFKLTDKVVTAYLADEKEPLELAVATDMPQSYFDAFRAELCGGCPALDTACVIAGARNVLLIQQAADKR